MKIYLKYFRHYVKLYGFYFWTGVLALALTDALDIIPPMIAGRGLDEIVNSAGVDALMRTALLYGGVTIALAIVRYHWRMQFGKYHQNVAREMRERIFNKLTVLGPSFYSKNPIGELMSLISNDVESVRMGMGPGMVVVTDAILYTIAIPPIMFHYSVPLTLKSMILLPTLPFFISWIGNIIHRRYMEVQNSFGSMSGLTQENVSGIRVIKSYVQEKNKLEEFNKSSRSWRDTNLKVAWAESFMHPVMEFCVEVGITILLYEGSKDVLGGALTIGGFFVLQRYIMKMVWPMTAIGWGFSLVSQARASLERIDGFLNTAPDVESPGAVEGVSEEPATQKLAGPIEVRSLSFKYPDASKFALKDISFRIEPGDTFGIVGPVGSGKTTLAQLLCHLYEVDRGHIFVNGHDIRDIGLQRLRKHISFVPQDTFLFSTSVLENMALGTEAPPPMESLVKVAEIAKLKEEIENLPQRYETHLGERGVNLSGGQKQRMTITRALLRRSPVIIFDDSLSAVDAETETLILNRLREETKEHTTIIISHRLSSLSLCNKIIVLRDGEIEALGTPASLREKSPTYRELLELQGYL